ncbi:hypothetical protein LQV05_004720 [Cryptococcus neoformans]|nr:hypothetical protein LQV05_004720 [Cryptococcus neoformans]
MSGSFHTGSSHNFGPKTNVDPQRGSHGGTGAELRSSGCWDMGLENNKHPIRSANQTFSTSFPHNSGYAVPSRNRILSSPAPASYISSLYSVQGSNYVAPPATPIRRLESVAHTSRQPREQRARLGGQQRVEEIEMQPLHSHPKHAMEEQFLHFLHPSRFLTSFKALPRSTQRAVITWSNNSLIEFTPTSRQPTSSSFSKSPREKLSPHLTIPN